MKILGTMLAFLVTRSYGEPIRLHLSNPHYYLFNGKPTILITSAEHYGAVVNKDFDYVAYLDALKAYGLNYTRIYAGAMFEVTPGNYVENLGLGLPGGTYKADWVDPASGSVLGSETFTHHGGNRTFTTPTHVVDIALRIKRN